MPVLFVSFFLPPQCTSFLEKMAIVGELWQTAPSVALESPVWSPEECFPQMSQPLIFLFQLQYFHLLSDALFVIDLLFQAHVLLRQVVNGGLILLHLSQMPFQPGEIRPYYFQRLVPLFPCI